MSEGLIYNNLLMQPISGEQLDVLLSQGYRILGHSLIQHNKSRTFGVLCGTIPLRIRLKNFSFSKSQRKLLRKNEDLLIKTGVFELTEDKTQLFNAHSVRFKDDKAESTIDSFLTKDSGKLPSEGREISLYENEKLIATSIYHQGSVSSNSTYGFFDPKEEKRSLGIFTMLLEIKMAIEQNKDYYYLGYTHTVPSQFDYKLNFNNLEKMDWNTFAWKPTPRVIPDNWLKYWEGESIEEWNGIDYGPK